jgi:general stress protein 26
VEPRTPQQRVADALARLESEADAWITTSSSSGEPHLIPLSLAWDGQRILMATPSSTLTVRNVQVNPEVRIALGDTQDVVVLRATAEAKPLESLDQSTLDEFVARVGWTPRPEEGPWTMLVMTPYLVHAWNGIEEFDGRTIMSDGRWIT